MKQRDVCEDRKKLEAVTTEKVQLWSATGIMMSGAVSNREAREMVADGRCWVISSQAIEFYEK